MAISENINIGENLFKSARAHMRGNILSSMKMKLALVGREALLAYC